MASWGNQAEKLEGFDRYHARRPLVGRGMLRGYMALAQGRNYCYQPGSSKHLLVGYIAGQHRPAPQVHQPNELENIECWQTRREEGPHPEMEEGQVSLWVSTFRAAHQTPHDGARVRDITYTPCTPRAEETSEGTRPTFQRDDESLKVGGGDVFVSLLI